MRDRRLPPGFSFLGRTEVDLSYFYRIVSLRNNNAMVFDVECDDHDL